MKVFIFGLGHLSRFIVNETAKDFALEGTWRTEKPGFDKVSKKIQFSAGDKFPKEIKKNYDWVLWSFPPVENYKKALEQANEHFDKDVPWVFVSSTSVYSKGLVNEESKRDGTRFRGENLIEIEDLLYSFKRPVSIIRPSGLVDEKRNPKNFFKSSDKKVPIKGENLNLVNTKDVARFIKYVMDNNLKNEDFNLSAPKEYEKSFFYKSLSELYNEEAPKFSESDIENSKKIDSTKAINAGFKYEYVDLLDFYKELAEKSSLNKESSCDQK